MKYIPGYLDSFISPVTGKFISNDIIPLPYNYILIGSKNNYSISSPALIDVWLEIKNINSRLGNTHFILQTASPNFFNSQALDQLNNNLLANSGGTIINASLLENNIWIGDTNNNPQSNPTIQIGNLPNLTNNYFWIGDSGNRAIESNVLPSGSLPDLTYHNIWIGDSSNRAQPNQRIDNLNLPPFFTFDPTVNYGIYNLYTGGINLVPSEPIAPTTTLRIDKSNLPNLSKGKIWMGVINITPPLISIGIDGVTISGDLNWDARGVVPIVGNSYAVPQEVGLEPGTIFMGDFLNPGQITQTGLAWGQMFIGNGFGQITTTGLLPYQLFSGDPAGSGRIIPITILNRVNLPILPLDNLWVGDGLEQAFPIPIGIGLTSAAGTSLNIADTGVVPGSYISANLTVNAQGQILSITDGGSGTVTEITLGTGLTGIPNPITTTGIISITPTGVSPGTYGYASIIVNAEGQLLFAVNNSSTIDDMQENITNNTTNIADNTSSINTINTTLFDPVTGIVTNVALLNTAIFAPVTGLVTLVGVLNAAVFDSFGGAGLVNQVTNNTSNIATNTSTIAGIIAGTTPISTTFTAIGDVSGSGPLSSSITLTLNTTLNNVPLATGNINANNNKIINVNDATNPKDAVNLETLESYVGGLPISLTGFVIGGPSVGGILATSRGPTCTLDVIPAASDVSFDNFSIIDLETIDFSSWSDMENKAQNGINFLFLWKFFGGGVS